MPIKNQKPLIRRSRSKIVHCLLLILFCIPVVAQMEDGSYQGFKVVKGQEQPDIVTINVLSLGNGICQFSESSERKPLQGTYHIILNKNKYNIGNFKKGITNGEWEEHFYGALYEKGTYKNGKYDGKVYQYGAKGLENKYPAVYTLKDGIIQHFISYYPSNGQVKEEKFYDDAGKLHGGIMTYAEDGTVTGCENYRHGQRNGAHMKIDGQGYKETSGYADGKLTGAYCRLYPNGNLQRKGAYDENGKRTGKWTFGEEDGNIKFEEDYLDDKLNGERRVYYKNGDLLRVEEFANGQLNGKSTEYDENPHMISREVTYADGRQNGEFKIFHKGILWREGISKDGRTVYEKEYEDGKLQIIRLLDERGSLVRVEQYNKTGQKTYKNTDYKKHPSIKLKENTSGVIDVEVE